MTLYYSLVFGVLVAEMVTFLVLVAPLPSNFHRSFVQLLRSPAMASVMLALKFTFAFILILFVDSALRVQRIGEEVERNQTSQMGIADRGEILARKFYAQRNLYLCGFTLFLSLILNRTFSLVKQLGDLRLELTGSDSKTESIGTQDAKAKLAQKTKELDALKSQTDGLQREYNRVCDELKALKGTASGSESKKDQ